MKKIIVCLYTLFATSFAVADDVIAYKENTVYSMGVLPIFSKQYTFEIWTPFLQDMTKNESFKFKMATTKTISEYEDFIKLDVYDFAVVSKFQYDNMVDKQEYEIFPLHEAVQQRLINGILNTKDVYYIINRKKVSKENLNKFKDNINNLVKAKILESKNQTNSNLDEIKK